MIPKEKDTHSHNNVTNLADVRKARALAESTIQSTIHEQDRQATSMADQPHDNSDNLSDEPGDDRHGNRRFDAEKVARIKAAIAAGEYKIDASRVADKFIEHDRNQ